MLDPPPAVPRPSQWRPSPYILRLLRVRGGGQDYRAYAWARRRDGYPTWGTCVTLNVRLVPGIPPARGRPPGPSLPQRKQPGPDDRPRLDATRSAVVQTFMNLRRSQDIHSGSRESAPIAADSGTRPQLNACGPAQGGAVKLAKCCRVLGVVTSPISRLNRSP
jgi:hypothetical protein